MAGVSPATDDCPSAQRAAAIMAGCASLPDMEDLLGQQLSRRNRERGSCGAKGSFDVKFDVKLVLSEAGGLIAWLRKRGVECVRRRTGRGAYGRGSCPVVWCRHPESLVLVLHSLNRTVSWMDGHVPAGSESVMNGFVALLGYKSDPCAPSGTLRVRVKMCGGVRVNPPRESEPA